MATVEQDLQERADAAGLSVVPDETVEPVEPEDEVVEEEPKLLALPLPGDWEAISGEFGGREPETSEIRLLGGKMPIDGSFAKGTEIDLLVRVKVTGVLGQDVLDDWGRTTRTTRRHMARMISVRRVPT